MMVAGVPCPVQRVGFHFPSLDKALLRYDKYSARIGQVMIDIFLDCHLAG